MARTADDLLTMFRLGKQSQRNFGMQIPNKDVAMSKRGDMASDWYKNWKKENGLPSDSNALPPVDSVPTWARPYLFPKAEAAPNKDMTIAQGFVKHVGEPISLRDATKALHIIKTTSDGNPLKEELRRKRLFKNNPIDINL